MQISPPGKPNSNPTFLQLNYIELLVDGFFVATCVGMVLHSDLPLIVLRSLEWRPDFPHI